MQVSFLRALALVFPLALTAQNLTGPYLRLHTNQGDIDIQLLPDSAPFTVKNFLTYANRGDYDNSIVHRLVAGFVWQTGGYQWKGGQVVQTQQDPPVRNEYKISNTRGTLAMAKLGSDPNSATNQFFFNLGNNASNLNSQNGGFTVFARVANNAGLAIMDKISRFPTPGVLPSPLDQIPLVNYSGGSITDQNLVLIQSITQLDTPTIDGVITASGYGAYASAAPGSFIEIYGGGMAGDKTRGWATSDFTNGRAPTTLENVSVTVNNLAAYVAYVSPTLVSVQLPAALPNGANVPVVVSNNGISSAPFLLPIRSVSAGLLAPVTFKAGDKQYVVAFHASNGHYVTNGTIQGVTGEPAAPGETLLFFGIGFGPVTPSSIPIAGQVVNGTASLATPVDFTIGQSKATVGFAGLAPTFVGLYQFNITLPNDLESGDQLLTVTLGSDKLQQSLYLPVQAPQN